MAAVHYLSLFVLVQFLVSTNGQNGIGSICNIGFTLQGVCQSVYDCAPIIRALSGGRPRKEVVDFMRRLQCGFQGSTALVCCSPELNFATGETVPTTSRSPPRPAVTQPNTPFDESLLPDSGICGGSLEDRILNGNRTDINEFPWMALLGYRNRTGFLVFECGGVLINNRYVLTAAHCVNAPLPLESVRLGEWDTSTNPDCIGPPNYRICAPPHKDYSIEQSTVHAGYSPRNINRKDDIALLRLSEEIEFNDFVSPVCLPTSRSEPLRTGDELMVAGWGLTEKGAKSNIKLKLRVPLFDKPACERLFRVSAAILTPQQVCAGGAFAKDACSGDSGGPLMKVMPDGDWTSVGIISFGAGCGRDGWPGVYIDISSYMDWIRQNLRK